MRIFSAADIDAALDFPSLVEALSEAMRGGFIAPARHHHEIERAGERTAIQLLMPAWTESASRAGLYLGAKIVNVFPGNAARGLPAVMGTYVLQSGRTGETLAALDGTRLTHWRTAAASALAARHLARADVRRLLDRRRRRARALSRARPCEPALLHGGHGLEPSAGRRAARRRDARGRGPARKRQRRPRGRGARGGCHLMRDALNRAADRRPMAERRTASRSRRGVHAQACARPTTRR